MVAGYSKKSFENFSYHSYDMKNDFPEKVFPSYYIFCFF